MKLTHFAEIAHLSNSRADRIMALESALSRFKMAVAEGVGDRELVTWFAENWVESDGGSVGGEGELKGNPFTFWKAKVR